MKTHRVRNFLNRIQHHVRALGYRIHVPGKVGTAMESEARILELDAFSATHSNAEGIIHGPARRLFSVLNNATLLTNLLF